MKPVTKSNRVIRVPAGVHQAAKIQAAAEDRTLADLAAEALEEALAKRRAALAADDTLRAATARPQPIQTR